MTFERPWVLVLALAPLLWYWFESRRTSRRLGLALKAGALCAILLALAEPRLSVQETKVAVSVLVDTSASLSPKDLERASSIAASIQRERGRNLVQVIPFARDTRDLSADESNRVLKLKPTAGEAGRTTDIENALRHAAAAAPAGLVPRIVLVSDGKENRGSVARALWQLREIGVPVDTFALDGRPRPALRLDHVRFPSLAFSGERFPIELSVTAPSNVRAIVEIAAEGKQLGSSEVALNAGANEIRLHASLATAGVVELSGTVRAEGLGEVRFAQAVALRRPRVLLYSQDPPGTEAHLLRTLAAAQFETVPARDAATTPVGSLEDYQVVVFNNWDLESIPPARKADLENYVREGGGLLVIGGEKNVYVENKAVEDALDRTLPAKLAPPRSPEGTCIILIMDKSSSMEGKKMELARIAAIGVIDNLRPIDMVGVLIFDNSFQWAVPIRRAEDKALIKRIIAGVTPDGGTQIAPALSEAYRRIVPVQATFKHVVLLTDGISEEGDSIALAKEAALQKVTISTIGLGQDVNRAYLEKVASFSKGKPYFLSDPSGLEQILLRDVMEHTGSTAVEKALKPTLIHQAEVLDGVGIESAPALKGYVRFVSKPSADMLLAMDQKDPLLVRWQFGLGRSAVFTSDAKSRWAADWVTWNGFDRFWANVFRDLLPHGQPGEASLVHDSATGNMVATYRLARHLPEPAKVPDIFLTGPGGFRTAMPLKKVAQGSYRGEAPVGSRQGLFRVRPLEESRTFPEVGFYRQEEELNDYGSNPDLLRQVASFTGGRFQPEPAAVFQSGGQSIPSTLNLWPGLLALAVLLSLGELLQRKWKGVIEFIHSRRRPAPAQA